MPWIVPAAGASATESRKIFSVVKINKNAEGCQRKLKVFRVFAMLLRAQLDAAAGLRSSRQIFQRERSTASAAACFSIAATASAGTIFQFPSASEGILPVRVK